MKPTTFIKTLSSIFVLLAGLTVHAAFPTPPAAPLEPQAPIVAAEETAAAPVEAECDDAASMTENTALATPATPVSDEAQAQCKTCPGKPYCKCTYNHMRRASCEPCCYANDIGFLTCLD